VSLGKGEWRVLQLKFDVPDTSNETSTVTVSAGTSSVTSIENFELFYIVIRPQVKSINRYHLTL